MRVPINPQTNVPQGELGYEKAVDVTAGTRMLGQVVEKYGEYLGQEQKKRELFDVQKLLVDETNNIQQDFEDKFKVQPLGAPNFTQQVNGEYNTRHQQMVKDLKAQGYSDDAVNEFETRLGTIRSQYVAKAIDFQEKSNFAKVLDDSDKMVIGLAQYSNKNPNAVGSALDEFRVSLTHSNLTAPEQEAVYNKGKDVILAGAREGFAVQHPEVVLGLYGLPGEITTTSPAQLPAGQEFNLPDYLSKMKGAEGTGKNPKSTAVGYYQFLDGTWKDTYKKVFGNTGESNAQILAKKKDLGVATKLAERLTNDNIAKLNAANLPVNATSVYLSHFLGVDGAIKVLSAHADATIRNLVSSAAIQANAPVFKKMQTVGDLIAWAQKKMGDSSTSTAVQMAVLPIPANWRGNQEDAIQELGMTADQAATFLRTGKDPRKGPKTGMVTQGNIDVSQLPAVPNPDGSVSTVRSISVEFDGKTYLIPTVIDGKVVSNDEAIASFKETGKHLGVFTDSKSADRYAQQLHESEAKRVEGTRASLAQAGVQFDANGQTGIAALDLSNPSERLQMLTLARTVLNEREATAKAAQRANHDAWLNDFYNKLQDGKLGQADLNSAYENGQITDFDERKKAQGILDDKVKKENYLDLFHTMLASGQKFNPFDDKAQKAADAGFENAVKFDAKHGNQAGPFVIAMRAWERTGILPSQGAIMLRGGLVSTDPKQVEQSAAVAGNMLRENPNAFAGVTGKEEIEHAAVNFNHYVYDLGMEPKAAANRVAQENDPKFKEKMKYNEPLKVAALQQLRTNGVNASQAFSGAKFANNNALGEANQTYYEFITDQLNNGVDLPGAVAQANHQMQKVYGVNINGRIVKYPPEKVYPALNGSWDYIYKDAQETVKQETGRDPVAVNLVPIPGVTDQDFRTGRPARYRLLYSHTMKDGQTVIDAVPGEFAVDVNHARQQASVAQRKQFLVEREKAIALQRQRELENPQGIAATGFPSEF